MQEPAVPGGAADASALRLTAERLGRTLRSLRQYRQALRMLLAFLIYNDGIGTIIRMATAYGTEIGIGQGELIAAVLMVQFVGVPAAFLFGALAGRLGAKRAIVLGLAVYAGVSVIGFFMRTAAHFFALALLVGLVQGRAGRGEAATRASCRSMTLVCRNLGAGERRYRFLLPLCYHISANHPEPRAPTITRNPRP